MRNDPATLARLAEKCAADPRMTQPAETAVVLLNYIQNRHHPPVAWLEEGEKILAWGPSGEIGPMVISSDTTIRLRNSSIMKTVQEWNHGVRATSAAVSADGKFVLTGGEDGCVRVWAVQGFLLAEISGERASFSRKGDKVIVTGPDGKARMMDISAPGKWFALTDFLEFNEGELLREVVDAVFCANDKAVVAITHNPAHLLVWSLEHQKLTKSFLLGTEGNALRGISVSENLRRAVTVCDAYTGAGFLMQIWDLETGVALPLTEGDGALFIPVDDAGLLADGTPVWYREGSLFLDGQPVESIPSAADCRGRWQLKRNTSVGASSAVPAPGYSRLLGPVVHAVGIDNDYVTTWSLGHGRATARTGLWNTSGPFGTDDMGFSPCGSWFWQRKDGDARGVLVYRNEPPPALSALMQWNSGWIGNLGFSADSKIVRARSKHGVAHHYDTETGARLCGKNHEEGDADYCSPDRFVDTSALRLMDAHSGQPVADLEATGLALVSPRAIVGPDGRALVTAWGDERQRTSGLRLWRLVSPALDGAPPSWFARFLQFLALGKITGSGEFRPMNRTEWSSTREELLDVAASGEAEGGYLRVLRKICRL